MTRKKSKEDFLLHSSNSIIKEMRDIRWLYNPVVYSQLTGDLNLMHQRILAGIIARLQNRIIESVEEHKRSNSFSEIFKESELARKETIELCIPASELGVSPTHYDQLQKAAEQLSRLTMKYPLYGKDGRVSKYVAASLFPRVEMQMTDSELRRTGKLRVVMLTENIRDIFTMRYGYIKHVDHIYNIARKKNTPRLYLYLSRFKDVGHKRVPYADFVEFLGVTDEYWRTTNNGENPYNRWSKVKQLILDPVKKEMETLAIAGEINFYFDYEPIYPNGKKQGKPLEISFKFFQSKMGAITAANDYRTNAICSFKETYVAWCPDLSCAVLQELMGDLDDATLQKFIHFALSDLRKLVEKKQPDDVAKYVVDALKRWKKENIGVAQLQLFEDNKIEEGSIFVPGACLFEWLQFVNEYDGPMLPLLRKAHHYGTKNGFILIEFDDKATLDAFNAAESDPGTKDAFDAMMQHFRSVVGKSLGRILVRGCRS